MWHMRLRSTPSFMLANDPILLLTAKPRSSGTSGPQDGHGESGASMNIHSLPPCTVRLKDDKRQSEDQASTFVQNVFFKAAMIQGWRGCLRLRVLIVDWAIAGRKRRLALEGRFVVGARWADEA